MLSAKEEKEGGDYMLQPDDKSCLPHDTIKVCQHMCAGQVELSCRPSSRNGRRDALITAFAVFGSVLGMLLVIFGCLRYKQVVHEFSAARINRIKRR